MTADLAFLLTACLYGTAAVLYGAYLWRGSIALERWAPRMLGGALAAQVLHMVTEQVTTGRLGTFDIHGALGSLSLLVGLGYLATMRRYRLTVLGAFVAPLTLLLFLGAGLPGRAEQVSPGFRSILLPVHVAVSVLGIVAFALASAAALAYVIEERLLRQKKIGGIFQRLPPLGVLDSIGLKLVMVGFPLFTLGVVTGSLWAVRHDPSAVPFPTQLFAAQGFAVLAWVFFGSVLIARLAVGWRGRRAAIGTMLGFLCSIAALIGYVLRDTQGLVP
jgi:ABC-type uncharacterized transport system permease subunit